MQTVRKRELMLNKGDETKCILATRIEAYYSRGAKCAYILAHSFHACVQTLHVRGQIAVTDCALDRCPEARPAEKKKKFTRLSSKTWNNRF